MLIEEVDNIANNEEVCKYCKGSGYHPNPKEEDIVDPRDPVPCPYCHGAGVINHMGD